MHRCNFQSTKRSKPSNKMPPYLPKNYKIKSTRMYHTYLLRSSSKPSSLISEISSKKIKYKKPPFAIATVSKASVALTTDTRNFSMIWDNLMARPIVSLKMWIRKESRSIKTELRGLSTLEYSGIFKKNLFNPSLNLRNYLYKRLSIKKSIRSCSTATRASRDRPLLTLNKSSQTRSNQKAPIHL